MIPITEVKNGKGKKYEYDGTVYDSKEEIWFLWWLLELVETGYIIDFEYQPEAFSLSHDIPILYYHCNGKTQKEKTRNLLKPHSYQADFKITWSGKAEDKFYGAERRGVDPFKPPFVANLIEDPLCVFESENISWVDVKPAHDMNNMTRQFVINQKWVFQAHGIYVQKIICCPIVTVGKKTMRIKYTPANALFVETFTPERFRYTDKSLRPRKINFHAPDLENYILTGGRMPF